MTKNIITLQYQPNKTKCFVSKIFSKPLWDRFCLNCFCNFEITKIVKMYKLLSKDHDHCEMTIPKKIKNGIK